MKKILLVFVATLAMGTHSVRADEAQGAFDAATASQSGAQADAAKNLIPSDELATADGFDAEPIATTDEEAAGEDLAADLAGQSGIEADELDRPRHGGGGRSGGVRSGGGRSHGGVRHGGSRPGRPGGIVHRPHPRPGRPGGIVHHPRPHRPHPRPIVRPGYPHRPYPRPIYRPRPVRPVYPYPPYNPGYSYECSAQDYYGRIYTSYGRINPQTVQQNAIYDCETQSGNVCTALGCRRY